MRTSAILALLLIANESIAAPVPKDAPPLSIEGKYNLVSVSSEGGQRGGGPGIVIGPGGGGGFGGGGRMSINSAMLLGPTTITKDEITIEGSGRISPLLGGGNTTMEYTLDTSKSPAFIDVNVVNLRGKKTKSLGLVEVNGNHLIIAIAKEGDERPKTTEEADGVTVYYLQKAPRTEYRIIAMTVGKEEAMEKELNTLAKEGFELVSTTQPSAVDPKSSVTTVHFILKRTVK